MQSLDNLSAYAYSDAILKAIEFGSESSMHFSMFSVGKSIKGRFNMLRQPKKAIVAVVNLICVLLLLFAFVDIRENQMYRANEVRHVDLDDEMEVHLRLDGQYEYCVKGEFVRIIEGE